LEFEVPEVSRNCFITANLVMDTEALIPGANPGLLGCVAEGWMSKDQNSFVLGSHCDRQIMVSLHATRLSR
jgi:hypothetical protein